MITPDFYHLAINAIQPETIEPDMFGTFLLALFAYGCIGIICAAFTLLIIDDYLKDDELAGVITFWPLFLLVQILRGLFIAVRGIGSVL